MKGKVEYANKTQNRINNVLAKNGEYLKEYYSFIGMNKTLDTKYGYILVVQKFVNDTGKELQNLNVNDFTFYITNVYTNCSASHAIRTHAALKLFGKYLYANHILSEDPMLYVERPKFVESDETIKKRENGYLSKKEMKIYKNQILEGVGTNRAKRRQAPYRNRDLLICSLFLMTGMRCSALGRIDVGDIHLEDLTLTVNDKGSKVKTYELAEGIVPVLLDWLDDRKELLNGKTEDALFISNRRTRMDQKTISDVVTKYAKNIEGKHITPHKLRATYGTQLYEATHDIYYVQDCMSHSSPKTTELYVRGQVNSTKKASNIMGGMF